MTTTEQHLKDYARLMESHVAVLQDNARLRETSEKLLKHWDAKHMVSTNIAIEQLREAVTAGEPPKCGGRGYCGRMPFCGCGEPDGLPERDPSKPAEAQGLFRKFNVTRVDGSSAPGGKHHGCEYFVLDVDHDPHAKAALQAYAAACAQSHPELSADLIARHGAAMPVGELTGEQIDALQKQHLVIVVNYNIRMAGLSGVHEFARAVLAAASTQPVREPLTDAQVQRLIEERHFRPGYRLSESEKICLNWYRRGLRDCEEAYGITKKGGES